MIYDNIIKQCEARKISIAKLEKETGLGNATIRGWAVSSPKAENLKKVADYLGCTVDDLMKEA